MSKKTLSLFQAFGIELEYMIVDRDTQRPCPIAEQILLDEDGQTVNEISLGPIDVSNELATHVLEFKTTAPTADLKQLKSDFMDAIATMNERLAPHNAILAPGGAHPFMDPATEGHTWSSGDRTIYETYDRIFNCSSHGWFNLQSCHLNLPFANEEEFARLHAAIILILPYLPALSASTPYLESRYTGFLDTRINVYKDNQKKVPQIAGSIVPEPVFTFADYQSEILEKTYQAIAPYDPHSILRYEWLNSRGAIARFDRNAIEIRVLDTQECPEQDLAICSLIISLLKVLCALDMADLKTFAETYSPAQRKSQLLSVAQDGFEAELELRDLADLIGLSPKETTVGELWAAILSKLGGDKNLTDYQETLSYILQEGNLAERMLAVVGKDPAPENLRELVKSLSSSLETGERFDSSQPLVTAS
ncbi:carboxylate-amine ligase [Pelagicoccus albus]|uniref:Glutamate--cysteine ligase n=1 Tax=Pelagicoccus albus TaxID=415222 RepID=A0A7X1E979_9BACT|nr:glutamate-cysteine ligase family protein [Pelagicoccus albus]MBC2607144.1 glutamate--cysteine ligase [Pelagicoccus albus]